LTLQFPGSQPFVQASGIGGLLAFVLFGPFGLPPAAAQPPADVEPPVSQPLGQEREAGDGDPREADGIAKAPSFLLIRADRQSADVDRSVVVAEGNVEARFEGWRLLADRVEVIETSRTVYATGRLRLYKGDQMLQASQLRYSQLEGTGELEDIYGVIDQEGVDREVKALRDLAGQQPESTASEAPDQGFACPELRSYSDQRPVLELLPPRRVPMPSIPAPPGCPGADAIALPSPLGALLSEQALPADAAERAADQRPLEQRVQGVRFRQAVDTAIKLNLVAVIDTDEETSTSGPRGAGILRRPKPSRGQLNRLRFQASNLVIRGNRWSAREVAFTNDPFTPANSWTIGYQVEAQFEGDGITRIQAQRTRILLSNRLAVPGINSAVIGEEALQFSLDTDKRDRDGIYLGYNLPTLRIGEGGKLNIQPQFMLQRAIQGRTDSYTAPGKSLAGPAVNQPLQGADLFGLTAVLNLPIDRFRLQADTSLSTLSPDNLAAGTRSSVRLRTPLGLAGHSQSEGQLFGTYRDRVYNGSLGLQTVVYSYGGQLDGNLRFNPDPADGRDDPRRTPYVGPIDLDWRAMAGNYQANLFERNRLDTQWRGRLSGGLTSSLRLWEASLEPDEDELSTLRYAAEPVRPGLALNFGLASSLARYGEGERQNTLTLFGGPAITLGRFRQPWFDYSQVALLVGGTLLDGRSPFGFDRAVDLRTLSFRAAQQLYGPLVLEAGATWNIDSNSRFYGDVSYSYVELKLQQRSYELGVFYSPYDGIGGIRIRLNDFSFSGSGTPFVPRPEPPAGQTRSESPQIGQ